MPELTVPLDEPEAIVSDLPVAPACSLLTPVNEPLSATANGDRADPTAVLIAAGVELPATVVIVNVVELGTEAT